MCGKEIFFVNLFGFEWCDLVEGIFDVDDFKIKGKCCVIEVLVVEFYWMN